MIRTRIRTWTLYRFSLPCAPPLYRREGLILKCLHASGNHASGNIGWGEISPLPGRSRETLAKAQEEVVAYLSGTLFPLSPSVAAGVEQATEEWRPPAAPVPLAALLMGSKEEILEKAEIAYAQGYRTAKVKVGTLSLDQAKEVLTALFPHFTLRVDVNQMWSFDEAVCFFSSFPSDAFAYTEDPFDDIKKLKDFPFPFALDAALTSLSETELAALPQLKALVLKPTLVGDLASCKKFKALADRLNVPVVLSSAWESGLGLLRLVTLSTSLNSAHLPLGLDTYRFLHRDLLCAPLDFAAAELAPPSSFALNMDLLEEIAHG